METASSKAETPNPAAPGKLRIGSHLHVMRAGDVSSKVASECQIQGHMQINKSCYDITIHKRCCRRNLPLRVQGGFRAQTL